MMRQFLIAFGLILLAPLLARAAGPVCAIIDPDKAPRVPLLEAKLLADESATWVERADIDKVLKEQKLQAAFSPQGVGDRVKLGKLLKADLLVIVREVKGAKEPALEVVVSETAGGLRLLVRPVPVTKDMDEDVGALRAAVRDGIKKHGEKITEVVAVPPFVSNNLELSHEHLKGAFAKLTESEALGRKGVVVVELAEAEALAKEISLAAPGAKIDRPLPAYLFGEYRYEGKDKAQTVTLKLRAERGGQFLAKPVSLTVKPAEAAETVRKWSAGVLDSLTRDAKPRPPADPKAEARQLADRSRVFRRLGNWAESLPLAEASLLLNPEQTDLYAEAHMGAVAALGPAFIAGWLRNEADQSALFGRLYVRALEHLEQFVTRGGDLSKYRSISGSGLMQQFTAAARDLTIDRSVPEHLKAELLRLRDERRAVYLRLVPILAKGGERKELSFVWTALSDLPMKERFELVERLVAQLEDLPHPQSRAVTYSCVHGHTPGDTPEFQAVLARWSGSKKKYLQEAAAELRVKLDVAKKATPPLFSTDPNPPSPNAPGPEAVKFQPIALGFGTLPAGRVQRPIRGILAIGPSTDVVWTADALYLMKQRGKLQTAWASPSARDFAGGGFSSVSFDGEYVWVAFNRSNATSILLLLDPNSGKVIDASKAEGLPVPPPSSRPEDFSTDNGPRLLLHALGPGRACLAGSFSGRAWIGTANFDAKTEKVTVKVFHEARDSQDASDKEQWKKTTVTFLPSMVYPVTGSGAGAQPLHRVLVGRVGGGNNPVVWNYPLVCDVDKGTVEAMKDVVTSWPHQGVPLHAGSVYCLEGMGVKEQTWRIVRLGFPGPGRHVVVDGLAPKSGYGFTVHDGRFHIALEQLRQQPPEKGPFTPTNPYMIRSTQWWSADPDGKNLRQVATRLPPISLLGVSAHYGLVAMVEPEPAKPAALNTVEITPPKK